MPAFRRAYDTAPIAFEVVATAPVTGVPVVPLSAPEGPPAIASDGFTVTVTAEAFAVVPPWEAVGVIEKVVLVATAGAVPAKVAPEALSPSKGEVGDCANDQLGEA